jgi:hypothetical protein
VVQARSADSTSTHSCILGRGGQHGRRCVHEEPASGRLEHSLRASGRLEHLLRSDLLAVAWG